VVERADDGKAKAVEVTGPNGSNPQVRVRSISANAACCKLQPALCQPPLAAYMCMRCLKQMTCSCSSGRVGVYERHAPALLNR